MAQPPLAALAGAQRRTALLVALEEVVALWAPLEVTLIVREALVARPGCVPPQVQTHLSTGLQPERVSVLLINFSKLI